MFASQIPSPERFSVKRVALSAVLHGAALALAVSLRFAAPVTPVEATRTRVVLLTAPRVAVPRPAVATPVVSAPVARMERRAFTAPRLEAPVRRVAVPLEASLPEQAVPPPPPMESRVPAVLPPPPIVVGKLAGVTAGEPSRAPQASLRATSFGAPAAANEPEPVRTPKTSGFGNASVSTDPQRRSAQALASATSVEIISKPRPLYTDEARRLKIEGEVLLEVLFGASGIARVERVLRGLGHGLDESASASAAEIRFRPAQRAGQAVDQTATVHITFQLAY